MLVPLYLFGPETTKNFALILTIGLFFGIYSSLFFASPLLIWVEEWQAKSHSASGSSCHGNMNDNPALAVSRGSGASILIEETVDSRVQVSNFVQISSF